MRLAWLVLPMATLALTACQEDEADLPIVGSDDCGAGNWTQLIGEDRDVLDDRTLPELVRIIGPNDVVTLDFLTDRLNIHYGEDGIVTRVECG
jgi:hypothetical protein